MGYIHTTPFSSNYSAVSYRMKDKYAWLIDLNKQLFLSLRPTAPVPWMRAIFFNYHGKITPIRRDKEMEKVKSTD